MSSIQEKNRFERNPKTVLALFLTLFSLGAFLAAEVSMRVFFGLGDPLLYAAHPFFGYRPVPNQMKTRFRGATLQINNLGLRAVTDWDADPTNKILFLGDSVTFGGSYIDTKNLFSSLALRGMEGYQSGNAAVNGWGVENIHGLVVRHGFQPAQYYVTTLIYQDFLRGITRLNGKVYWAKKPRLAFEELAHFFLIGLVSSQYVDWRDNPPTSDLENVIVQTVGKLAELDRALKAKGFGHRIYLSPAREEVLRGEDGAEFRTVNERIRRELTRQEIAVDYLATRIAELGLSEGQRTALFYDDVHLEKAGHELWARLMREDLGRFLPPISQRGQASLPNFF